MSKYSIGVDFGTGSGRVVVIDVKTGEVVGSHITEYKHGVITSKLPNSTKKLKRDTALQHPQDYLNVLEQSIPRSLEKAKVSKEDVIGIGLDFTACTILPIDESFQPLSFRSKWKEEPNAWVKLWKHHAAQEQADRINALAEKRNEEWLHRYGGIISSEWMLPKVLEIVEDSPEIYEAAAYIVEAADWLTSLMTGNLKRNSCAAGFKGMWNKAHGYVSKEFLKELHPSLENIYEKKLSGEVVSIGERAGLLTEDFARKIGLEAGTPVSMGMIDAHAGVLGAGVTKSNEMVLVMGTSTCHMLLSEKEVFVEGISGVAEDGIIPGLFAYEAGQAAVGDIFEWYINENILSYVKENSIQNDMTIHEYLENLAANLQPGANGLIALDWHNGCRTPLVDGNLSGMLIGLTLSTKPEQIYRALIEATAFGTKLIMEQFQNKGIEINGLVACGGLPQKNDLMMQIYSDVTGMPIKIASSSITPAIGAAMCGSLAAGSEKGGYDDITKIADQMVQLSNRQYEPNHENTKKYAAIYEEYKRLVDYFGKGTNNIMKNLKSLYAHK